MANAWDALVIGGVLIVGIVVVSRVDWGSIFSGFQFPGAGGDTTGDTGTTDTGTTGDTTGGTCKSKYGGKCNTECRQGCNTSLCKSCLDACGIDCPYDSSNPPVDSGGKSCGELCAAHNCTAWRDNCNTSCVNCPTDSSGCPPCKQGYVRVSGAGCTCKAKSSSGKCSSVKDCPNCFGNNHRVCNNGKCDCASGGGSSTCPSHSHFSNNKCVCDSGYKASGGNCVKSSSGGGSSGGSSGGDPGCTSGACAGLTGGTCCACRGAHGGCSSGYHGVSHSGGGCDCVKSGLARALYSHNTINTMRPQKIKIEVYKHSDHPLNIPEVRLQKFKKPGNHMKLSVL